MGYTVQMVSVTQNTLKVASLQWFLCVNGEQNVHFKDGMKERTSDCPGLVLGSAMVTSS